MYCVYLLFLGLISAQIAAKSYVVIMPWGEKRSFDLSPIPAIQAQALQAREDLRADNSSQEGSRVVNLLIRYLKLGGLSDELGEAILEDIRDLEIFLTALSDLTEKELFGRTIVKLFQLALEQNNQEVLRFFFMRNIRPRGGGRIVSQSNLNNALHPQVIQLIVTPRRHSSLLTKIFACLHN